MPIYLSAMGIVCTLGRGKEDVAQALFQGSSSPFTSDWPLLSGKSAPVCQIPFELPELPSALSSLNSRNNRMLMNALDEIRPAIDASIAKYGPSRVGIVMATSTSGMLEEERAFVQHQLFGTLPEEYHYPQTEISSPSIFASQYLKVQGPVYTISTACSSASKALCSAKRLIIAGICDAVVIGGVDTLCNTTLNGFDSLELISKQIGNPFSKNRSGITIGEGAAVFLATREGSYRDIELCGYGESSDAHHICSPQPNGLSAQAAINSALAMSGLKPEDISYIHLHGTGTALNDSIESSLINRIFGNKTPCSSTKALTGHTLGASGAIAAAFLWLSLSNETDGKIPLPPHVWDGVEDPSLPPIHLAGHGNFASPINGAYALMCNSFAFGGSNVSIILKKCALPNYPIADLIPHSAPMALINHVVAYHDEFIHCRVKIHNDSPFCENGSVPSYIAMEYMAQTVAAWNGLMAKRHGEDPKIGFLLSARRLDLSVASFNLDDELDIFGKPLYIDGEMASFDCWIEIKGLRVAHAGLNVYQPKNFTLDGGDGK